MPKKVAKKVSKKITHQTFKLTPVKTKMSMNVIAFAIFGIAISIALILGSSIKKLSVNEVSEPPVPSLPFMQGLQFKNEGHNDTYIIAPSINRNISNPLTVEAWVNIPKPTLPIVGFRQYPIAMQTSSAPKPHSATIFSFVVAFYEKDPSVYNAVFNVYIPRVQYPYPGQNPNDEYLSIVSKIPLKTDTWNHIAITSYSEGNYCKLNLFQNGVLVNSVTSSQHTNCQISNYYPQSLTIGKPLDGYGNPQDYFTGQIDDFRVSNTIRYTKSFIPQDTQFVLDAQTAALRQFNGVINDGNRSNSTGKLYGTHYSYVRNPNMELGCKPLPTCVVNKSCQPQVGVVYCSPEPRGITPPSPAPAN